MNRRGVLDSGTARVLEELGWKACVSQLAPTTTAYDARQDISMSLRAVSISHGDIRTIPLTMSRVGGSAERVALALLMPHAPNP